METIGARESDDQSDEVPTADDKTATRRSEEFPGDVRAFFGHPLTAATTAINGEALALLHEYHNLPAIDRTEMKIGESNEFLNTILSDEDDEEKRDWVRPDVEQFLNKDKAEDKENQVANVSEQNDESDRPLELQEIIVKSESEPGKLSCCMGTPVHAPANESAASKEPGCELPSQKKLIESTKKILSEKILKKRREQRQNCAQNGGAITECPTTECSDLSEHNRTSPIKKDGFLHQLSDDIQTFIPSSAPESLSTNSTHSDIYQTQCSDSFSAMESPAPPYQWAEASNLCQQEPPPAHFKEMSKPNDFYYNNFPQSQYIQQQQCYPSQIAGGTKYADLTNYKPTEPYMGQQPSFNHAESFSGISAHQRAVIDYNSKSPDSGIGDPCMSPVEPSMQYHNAFSYANMVESAGREKVLKRRRSAPSVRQMCYQHNKHSSPFSGAAIPKLEYNSTGYVFTMETPISTSQRIDEDRMTYLNKGQFYTITFENINCERVIKSATVKSVISVVFRDDKTIDEELKAWEFWHSRQHSIKQRVLDIDTKNSEGILSNCIEELALNSVATRWDPREGPAKVSLCVNCLSTDFSNQKGVKGLPLHIQIDTYEDMRPGAFPVHRSYCQFKAFCDKGAERKTRDEEKRKDCKDKHEPGVPVVNTGGRKRQEDVFHPPCDRSEFYHMADLQNRPLLFNPAADYGEMFRRVNGNTLSPGAGKHVKPPCPMPEESVPVKRPRMDVYYEPDKVLLYVREKTDTVFTALLLLPPTLTGLAHSIQEKYGIPPDNMKTIYKRSKKGILVKLDDNIIKHYSNESMFIIELDKVGKSNDYEITLAEIDAP